MKLKTGYFNSNDPQHKIGFKKDLQSDQFWLEMKTTNIKQTIERNL